MRFFSNLFKKKTDKPDVPKSQLNTTPEDVQRLTGFVSMLEKLESEDKYIAKRDYISLVNALNETYNRFSVISNSGVLAEYCRKYSIDPKIVEDALLKYRNIDSIIDQHNNDFIAKAKIAEKEYFDNILKDVDPKISLDDNQREVVLTDEDYCLVIAGAGAGKTTTVAAKVKYLVEKKGVSPNQILVISFTNKAVDELKDKINNGLSIKCPITTFHSAGNAVIRKHVDQKLNIVDPSVLYYVLMDYFKQNALKNERLVKNLILFFSSYFDAPYKGEDLNLFFNSVAKANFATLKSDLNEYILEISDTRSKKQVTIANEVLRSRQEVEIANFLYLNSIEYQYEPIYPFNIQYSRKPYTPDFVIRQGDLVAYIEHFGISDTGKNNRYSIAELEKYKKAINDKIKLHKEHGTILIYTFSEYKDNSTITDHLQQQLMNSGFVLNPRSQKEVVEKLVSSEESRYIRKLVSLITRFINNFKTNAYTGDDFASMYNLAKSVRTKLFLEICEGCYYEYQRYLTENNAVDFQDMINESVRILKEVRDMNQKLDFKYIIVDEYQDISRQRFDLTKELSAVTDAKIIAVGDDWQSIYAFSGSDISLFTKFREIMGYGKLLKIENTYRNAQEVIDIAGNFIQKNTSQIQKELVSPKRIQDPVIIYTYDSTYKSPKGDNRTGVNYAIAHAVEVAIEQIIAYNKSEGKSDNSKILILGRFGFDGDHLERSGLFEYVSRGDKVRSVKYPKLDITFMTAHSSKGLGYDNVIVINGRNETYGFPAKIEDDPVLKLVVKHDKSYEYAEERRLFYVAMTRTKNRVYFIAPEQNPSEFLIEIKRDYKTVVLKGNWNDQINQTNTKNKCPICGYPLQLKYKISYGLRLYICSNEPEICGFLTNDLKGGKMSIEKCDKCTDGYLVVKRSTEDNGLPFLGCTNYKRDGTGCKNTLAIGAYYKMHGIKDDPNNSTPDIKTFSKERISKAANIAVDLGLSPATVKVAEELKSGSVAQTSKPEVPNTSIVKDYTSHADYENSNQTFNPTPNITSNLTPLKPIYFNGLDLVEVVGTILQCVIELSEKRFFAIDALIDVLSGSDGKVIKQYKLDTIPFYGMFANISRDNLETIFHWLINNKFLLQKNRPYPILHLTYNGIHFREVISNAMLKNLARTILDNNPASVLTTDVESENVQSPLPVLAGKPWSADEDNQLKWEVESGFKVSDLAKRHSRTREAIRARIKKLKL